MSDKEFLARYGSSYNPYAQIESSKRSSSQSNYGSDSIAQNDKNTQNLDSGSSGPRYYKPYRPNKTENSDAPESQSSNYENNLKEYEKSVYRDSLSGSNRYNSGETKNEEVEHNVTEIQEDKSKQHKRMMKDNLFYYHLFNTRKLPYKLRYYMYFSNDLNVDFNVHNYNKWGLKMGRPPNVHNYNRFYEFKYENELIPEDKVYGNLYCNTDENNVEVITDREYKGFYSNQLDYVNFRMAMTQEKQASTKN